MMDIFHTKVVSTTIANNKARTTNYLEKTLNKMNKEKSILFCGLGGGLDVVNASLLYFIYNNNNLGNGKEVDGKNLTKSLLGSVRPASINKIKNTPNPSVSGEKITPFTLCGTWITPSSDLSLANGRYAEGAVSKKLNDNVLYFSRGENKKELVENSKILKNAIEHAKEMYNIEYIFFVDGGGDSLILKSEDSCESSQYCDPFKGGDAFLLHTVKGIPNVILAVIAVGLDVNKERFQNNLQLLRKRGAYYGRVNIVTGEKQDYQLDSILPFSSSPEQYLKPYFDLTEDLLVLNEKHQNDPSRFLSHTATVTYHALKGNFGEQRTFVDWEPVDPITKKRGVIVEEGHQWMYFFSATAVEELKIELNKK